MRTVDDTAVSVRALDGLDDDERENALRLAAQFLDDAEALGGDSVAILEDGAVLVCRRGDRAPGARFVPIVSAGALTAVAEAIAQGPLYVELMASYYGPFAAW